MRWIAVPLVTLALAGCSAGSNGNTDACARFESAYNELQDSVHASTSDSDDVRSLVTGMPSALRSALKGASGEVEATMKDSRDYALAYAGGNDDAGRAFFLHAATDMTETCDAAGRPLDLH